MAYCQHLQHPRASFVCAPCSAGSASKSTGPMSLCRKRNGGEAYASKRWTHLFEGAVTVWTLKLHITFVNYSRTLCTSTSARPV